MLLVIILLLLVSLIIDDDGFVKIYFLRSLFGKRIRTEVSVLKPNKDCKI